MSARDGLSSKNPSSWVGVSLVRHAAAFRNVQHFGGLANRHLRLGQICTCLALRCSAQLDAAEIRIRAERRLGELLIEQKATVGLNTGAAGIGTIAVVRDDRTPTLADIGVSKNLSIHAQKVLTGNLSWTKLPQRRIIMNQFTRASLDYLWQNWDRVIDSGASAAALMGVNPSTLRARLAAGKALAMRDETGRERASVDYTGRHLVSNMLFDKLVRWNVTLDANPEDLDANPEDSWTVHSLVDQIYQNVLQGERQTEAFIRVDMVGDQQLVIWCEGPNELTSFLWDRSALVVPIGLLVTKLAALAFMKHSTEAAQTALRST